MHETGDLLAFAAQGGEHLERVRGLLGQSAPPDLDAVQRALAATRGLRGSATLLGLDPFQSFLGRLFQLLEEVESGEVPWSSRLDTVLGEAARVEASYIADLEGGEREPSSDALLDLEERLAAWRRQEAKRRPDAAWSSDSQREMSQSAVSHELRSDLETASLQLRHVRSQLEATPEPAADLAAGLGALQQELTALQQFLKAGKSSGGRVTPSEGGLRNLCEGGLRQLVEAAAQEVLDEAHERGTSAVLRVTGKLETVDDELGGTLLEVLSNLWSDSVEPRSGHAAARIDTVIRDHEQRLVVEVRDEESGGIRRTHEDDVLGRYPGLRRSRPLVEALDGLVWVEPEDDPGCRFRVTLPLSLEQPHAWIVRVGRRDIALPPSALEAVYRTTEVRTRCDEAGAFVEAGGMRVPILHLAFVLGDVSYDELVRELVVVVGSFERRAAIFASGPQRLTRGLRRAESHGAWSRQIATELGTFPLLDVGALLGRRATEPVRTAYAAAATRPQGPPTILVVDSSEVEREVVKGMLGEAAYRTIVVESAEEAWGLLGHQTVDLIACDLRLPQMNAQQIAERRRRTGEFARTPVLLLLSHAGEQSNLVVQQLGASAYVRSPVQREELMGIVRRLTD